MSRLDKPIVLPFGKWQPDLPPWRNDGAITASGVIGRNGWVSPIKKPVALTAAVDGVVLGSFAAIRSLDSVVYNFAATNGALFELASNLIWTNKTRLIGGSYTTTAPDRWEFDQFGELVIAVNGWSDDPQAITLGAANFNVLGGAPPKARHLAIVQNFVVMGNTLDTVDGARNQRVWWSGFNDATYWTPNIDRQCSFRDLVGQGGPIKRIIGGEFGTILRDRSLARMSYIGPPGVFQFDEIEGSHGTIAPASAIKYGGIVYYLSDDGFYAFDGDKSAPIGRDVVDRTFMDDLNPAFAYNVIAAVDPVDKNIHWIYPGTGSVGGIPNRDLILNPSSGRFTLLEITAEQVAAMYSSIASDIDSVDSLFTSIDSVIGFWDDPAFAGGRLSLGFFDSNHKLNFLTGNNFAATVDTGEKQLNPTGRAFVGGLRPMTDAQTGVTITCLEREQTWTPTVTVGESATPHPDTGEANPRSETRFHRFRMTIDEDTDWTKAEGVALTEVEASGAV